ncbi:thioredoxin [Pseudoclavibacter caeni]|jgi:thioredoxin 1|uniref:Thioredoxin n=1 Tax=Pseudoclavibacter caeni TaxID=908846 RepID=A0A7C8FYL4_9MICO|nr:thioredoxin [Pseudoclavibacter caeni]KAB1633521.1 thioredoxin [Pseudoclavibacter caeni]NYJ96479.1 thioredoxin 1 [Pseudoclavibacter caeni]
MSTRQITLANLEEVVTGNDIVLLDFWAAWCMPCRMFGPVFEAASEQHPDIVFGKVDTETEQQLAAMFQVSSIPTLIVFREGIPVFGQPGALVGEQLEQLITAVQALDMDEVRADIEQHRAEQAAKAEGAEAQA